MKLHDFDKATSIMQMISIVDSKIKDLTEIEEIQVVKKNSATIIVRDMSRSIAEKQFCKEITNVQHDFIKNLRITLKEYRVRLEKEFDEV